MKKFLAVFLSLLLIAATIPFGAVSVSAAYETITAKLDKVIAKYPDESTWTKSFDGGIECYGFAKRVIYEIFGQKASNYRSWLYNGTPTKGMTAVGSITTLSTTKVKGLLSKARPGDALQLDIPSQHSMIIYKVESDGVWIYDCNYEGYCEVSLRYEKFGAWKNWNTNKMTLLRADNYDAINIPTLTIQYHANGGAIASEITGTTYKVSDSAGLNMRKDAGVNKAKLTALPYNTTFTVKTGDTKTADGYTWGKTTYGGYTGWVVISDFVTKVGSSRNGDYYLSSSIVYLSSKSQTAITAWQLGTGGENGLYNAATFGLVRDGYNFVGWCTKADGSATVFDQNDSTVKPEDIYPNLKNGNATVTLYAIWEKAACNHVPIVTEEGYPATCTDEGLTDRVECSLCGAVLAEQEIISTLEHEAVLISGYAPTCAEEGLTDGEECGICGEILSEQEAIPTLEHTIVTIEGCEPTCTEDGWTDGEKCTVCGEILVEQEIIYAYDHDIEYIEGYEPTCTENGLSEGERCTVCGEVLVEQEVIYAYDHDIKYIEGYEPTCTEDGLSEGEVCAVCGEVLVEQEVIPATGHEADIIYGYEATCTEEGLTDGEECRWCGEVLVEQQVIPMIPHEPYTVDGYEATCTEEGLTEGEECYWCGEILVEQQIIPMIPHEPYLVDGYEATCTEEGLTDGEECWWCGEVLVEQETIPALGHEIVIIKGYEATCTEDGLTDGKKCVVCGEIFVKQEDIYAFGHAYSNHYDATCNECGAVREVPEKPVDTFYGDANGDDSVNARDAALLQQFVAGWDVIVNETSADANGDGSVNARDAALLQQYVAGWDVTLG